MTSKVAVTKEEAARLLGLDGHLATTAKPAKGKANRRKTRLRLHEVHDLAIKLHQVLEGLPMAEKERVWDYGKGLLKQQQQQ